MVAKDLQNNSTISHLAVLDPEKKPFERLIFPTKYGIPKSSKPVSHSLSKILPLCFRGVRHLHETVVGKTLPSGLVKAGRPQELEKYRRSPTKV